jgi:uncharacterized repeat protein (TIGR01451 family)
MRVHFARALLVSVAVAAPLHASSLVGLEPGESATFTATGLVSDKAGPHDVTLRRMEIHAPGARILVQNADGSLSEVPRSPQRFFSVEGGSAFEPTWIALDPDATTFEGTKFTAAGPVAFEGRVSKSRLDVTASHKIHVPESQFSCGTEGSRFEVAPWGDEVETTTKRAAAKAATHQAVIAFDTDNEFMSLKFANNTSTAANYVAQLIAGLTLFYERDLDIRLVQGDTILRVAPDPYVQSTPGTQLNEVAATWRDTPSLQAIDRAFVIFLSGKSGNPNSNSGVAWLLTSGNYCNFTGQQQGSDVVGHYSANQVFRFVGSTAASDLNLIGHELGHNFGAAHTHCTNLSGSQPTGTNTIDQCFRVEPGCYSGTVSCPTDNSIVGRGSIMSYCNFSAPNGAACGQILQEFHPVHQGVLDARVATNIGNGCFTPISTPQADLSISITDNGATTTPGAGVAYSVNVSNAGPSAADAVALSYPLPAGTTFVSGIGAGWSCSNNAGTVGCTRATLASGAGAPLVITIGVPGGYASPATITSTISVDSDTDDPSSGNNSAGDTTPVLFPSPDGIFCSGFNDWPCVP